MDMNNESNNKQMYQLEYKQQPLDVIRALRDVHLLVVCCFVHILCFVLSKSTHQLALLSLEQHWSLRILELENRWRLVYTVNKAIRRSLSYSIEPCAPCSPSRHVSKIQIVKIPTLKIQIVKFLLLQLLYVMQIRAWKFYRARSKTAPKFVIEQHTILLVVF